MHQFVGDDFFWSHKILNFFCTAMHMRTFLNLCIRLLEMMCVGKASNCGQPTPQVPPNAKHTSRRQFADPNRTDASRRPGFRVWCHRKQRAMGSLKCWEVLFCRLLQCFVTWNSGPQILLSFPHVARSPVSALSHQSLTICSSEQSPNPPP